MTKKLDVQVHLRRILGPGIRLSADATTGERRPIWIQAAVTGTWKGHPAHPEITFTEQTFDTIIANFHANPAYEAGADGIGIKKVIRLDYEHTSELGVAAPGVTEKGIPAPGFVMELRKQPGDDGVVELWALVDMGEQLWGQVSRGEYLWTSVAVDPNAKDRESGAKVGNTMTSLAMTNNPFILGMEDMTDSMREQLAGQKIAACMGGLLLERRIPGKRIGEQIRFTLEAWGKPETVLELIVGLRSKFEMPEETKPSALLLEVAKLEAMIDAGTLTEDATWLVQSLRSMVGLPRLATHKEIVTALKALLAPLVEKESQGGGTLADLDQPVAVPPAPAGASETQTMTTPAALNSRLATALKLSNANEDDLVDAVRGLVQFRSSIVSKLSSVKTTSGKVLLTAGETEDAKILAAADGAAAAAAKEEEAKESLDLVGKLKAALGASEVPAILTEFTKMSELAAKYGDTAKQLTDALAKLNDSDVKKAEEEVAAIAASHKLDDRTKSLILFRVFAEVKSADGQTTTKVLAKGPDGKLEIDAVKEMYPVQSPDGQRQMLTSTLFAGPGGAQLAPKGTGGGGGPVPAPTPVASGVDQETLGKINACAGRNEIERTSNYLLSAEPAFVNVPEAQRPFYAGQFLKTGKLALAAN